MQDKEKSCTVLQSDVDQQHVQYMHCQIHYTTSFNDMQFEQENDAVYLDLQGDYSETMETGSFQGELLGVN